MTRTNRNGKGEGNQPLLFPIGDMGPQDDPVGDALAWVPTTAMRLGPRSWNFSVV